MQCLHCFRKNTLVAVSHIVENDFEGVENVHELYEHLLIKPIPQRLLIKPELAIKMSVWYSLIFTPFIGPFITLITACICFFLKDKAKFKEDTERWKQLTYCSACQKIS